MGLELNQKAEQKLVLTQSMRQSLGVLQMALPELLNYVQEQALSNPLLELEFNSEVPFLPDYESFGAKEADHAESDDTIWDDPEIRVHSREETSGNLGVWDSSASEHSFLDNLAAPGESFTDMLHEQLLQFYRLDSKLMPLCEYLVQCLSENGYLEFDLTEISSELQAPLFQVEQALYVIQSLQPTGVGARTLTECLVLQLAQGNDFNAQTIRLVREGLPLLAKNDIAGIAKLTGCSKIQAQQAADAVRRLNPIPSRGYNNGGKTEYQVPEANLRIEQGQLVIEMNRSFMPQIRFSMETNALLKESGIPADLDYLKKQSANAKQLIQCVENRSNTIEKLLKTIAQRQSGFFYRDEALHPMKMSQLATELGLNVSTVSRALQNKSITFGGKTIQLKNLFASSIPTTEGAEISSSSVKRQIERFVQEENPARPLSDEGLRMALEAVQLPVSRRTVAKYREELGIPASNQRKKHHFD